MEKEYDIYEVVNSDADIIALEIRTGKVKMKELQATHQLKHSKRMAVDKILQFHKNEDDNFKNCNSAADFKSFMKIYPESIHFDDAEKLFFEKLAKEEDDAYTKCQTIEDCRSFIENFPESKKIAVIRARIEELRKAEIEESYKICITIADFQAFIDNYPNDYRVASAKTRIQELENQKIQEILANANDYRPDQIIAKLNPAELSALCEKIKIDPKIIKEFKFADLNFGKIPTTEAEIPLNHTDVFFWGIPSSGKTCALAAILNTMDTEYVISDPEIQRKFGVAYKDSLVNIFKDEIGYLPNRTNTDRTQYMPMKLKRRQDKKYRNLSFFELSGEVFRYFYEVEREVKILEESDREHVLIAFETLELLLSSNNKKIHFFFIDYSRGDIKDRYGLTQRNYLDAAQTYFRDKKDILRKKTDGVYVVVTKADEIEGGNDKERTANAKIFLDSKFGGFINELKSQCKKSSVKFEMLIFSIGDVYFKRICRINRKYSRVLIERLFENIDAEYTGIFGWFRKIFLK